ncbi:WD40 repeat domain-containing protein [Streptomyces sp. NPDC093149]|uniref:WD40 repeat domain-containing protein n=1 Tax=Streptomyces sp. NPDC093149 TaxID=3366031 RepID=UPI0038113B09
MTASPQLRHTITTHAWAVRAVATVTTSVVDGRPVAVTGSDDRAVRMWDLATGEQFAPFLSFPAPVQALAVAPGGELLVGFDKELARFSPR